MIRQASPADTPALTALTAATGVFKPYEVEVLKDVLDEFHAGNAGPEHAAIVLQDEGGVHPGLRLLRPGRDDRPDLAPVLDRGGEGGAGPGLRLAADGLPWKRTSVRAWAGSCSSRPLRCRTAELTRRFYLEDGLRAGGAGPRLLQRRRRPGRLPQAPRPGRVTLRRRRRAGWSGLCREIVSRGLARHATMGAGRQHQRQCPSDIS